MTEKNRGSRSHRSHSDDPEDHRERTDTMGEISHVHPYADRGAMTRVFSRGRVVADGGESDEKSEPNEKTMADVSHETPDGAGDSAGVFERGHEYRVEYR